MPPDCHPRTRAAQAAGRDVLPGWCSGRSADTPPLETISAPKSCARIRRVMREPVAAARRLQPDPAEQLEALHREHQGHLSRQPAAHVLHHLPAQPAVAEGRPGRERERRQPHQLFDGGRRRRQGIRAGQACARRRTAIALEAPELLKSVDEFGDGIGLQILSVFPGFVLQQIRNSLAVRPIVPRAWSAPNWCGPASASPTTTPSMTSCACGRPTWSARPASSRWRTAPRPASCSAALAARERTVGRRDGRAGASARKRAASSEAAVRGFWKAYRGTDGNRRWKSREIDELQSVQDLNAALRRGDRRRSPGSMAGFLPRQRPLSDHHAENARRGTADRNRCTPTSRAMLRDRIKALRQANVYEAQRYRHVLGTPRIDKRATAARSRARTQLHGGAHHAHRRDHAVRDWRYRGSRRARRRAARFSPKRP